MIVMDACTITDSLLLSPYTLFVFDKNSGLVTALGRTFASHLGLEADRFSCVSAEHLNIWAHPNDGQRIIDILKEGGQLRNFEIEFVDAQHHNLSYVLSSMKWEKGLVLVSGHLNSDKKEIEAALRYSETLYKEAQEIAHLGHWEFDLVRNRLIWSEEIFRIFEINPKEFSESYDAFLDIIHPDDREMVDRVYRQSVEEKKKYDVVHRLRMPDGRIKYVHERGHSEWNEEGNPIRSIGTVQDITSFKEAEMAKERLEIQLRQSQKLEAIGTLVSGIAHDFNNILFAILGYTELALEKATDKLLHEDINSIQEAGNRAKELVTQILTFSRKQSAKKQPVEVSLIVKEVLKLIRATLPASIAIHKSIRTNKRVLGDSAQIHQVLMNLITNAAQAMSQQETGLLTVEIEDVELDEYTQKLYSDLKPGKYLKMVVGDTGIGMDIEVQERIFEPFYTTKPVGTGTGLGLSVVHGIIKNHQGQILVYSEKGKGTTFKIFLPVVELSSTDRPITKKALPGGSEKILVVDDEPVIARLLKRMLESLGYKVQMATDPFEASRLLMKKGENFDLLITDMNMPGMSGVRLVKRISENGLAIPTIITSGLSDQITLQLVENYAIRKILQKPIVKNELGFAVREVLDASPPPPPSTEKCIRKKERTLELN